MAKSVDRMNDTTSGRDPHPGGTGSHSISSGESLSSESASIGEVVEYITAYAKQETLGPLRGAGRWLAFGAAASVLLGLGLGLVLLGLLRLLQTEWTRSATGSLSWLSYAIVAAVGIILLVLTMSRIRRTALYSPNKETT
jgi:hypothetical protein